MGENKLKQMEEKIEKEIVDEVKEEIKKDIPSSPETKTSANKESAADKVAEEVVEESEKAVEKIAKAEVKSSDKSKGDKKTKQPEKPRVKKELAFVKGVNIHMSKKHGMYICSFIKGKKIDNAISDLEDVKKMKKAVPFKGEIPHRKGNIMSGRYPVKAAGFFINMLKALKGNSIVNGLELDKTVIVTAMTNWGMRPARRGNRRAKRSHVYLEAREMKKSGGML